MIIEHFGYSQLDLHKDKEVIFPTEQLESIVSRINSGEPLQYVLGEAWFYGRLFIVNPSVLIPRPETEILIEQSLKSFSKTNPIRVLDLGTGSGCIPVTLAAECSSWNIVATDISPAALEVARKNALRHQVIVSFLECDMLTDSPKGKFDLILSNPPYIPYSNRELLQPQVVEYEPHSALFAPDEDPLLFHRAIARWSRELLLSGGKVLVEIQDKTGQSVCDLFDRAGLESAMIIPDLDGKERFVSAVQKNT